MGVGILAIGIIEMALAGDLSASQRAGALVILATESTGVALRRTNLGVAYVLVLLAALGGAFWPNGYNSTWLPELILLYTVSERSGAVVSALALVATFAMRFPPNGGFHLSTVPFLIQIDFLYAILAWFAGRAQARRRAIACDLERTTALIQEEQEQLARSAIGIERARIVGELHALVVRGVEQMNADTRKARRFLVGEVGRASGSIGAIEETGRAALVEMRRLLLVLRTRDEAVTPTSPDGDGRGKQSARSPSVGGGFASPSSSMGRGWSHAADFTEPARGWMATPRVTDGVVVLAMVTLAGRRAIFGWGRLHAQTRRRPARRHRRGSAPLPSQASTCRARSHRVCHLRVHRVPDVRNHYC
jgi:hypothetical protein